MLFYTSKIEDIKMIPDSYLVILISSNKNPAISHPNLTRVNNLLPDMKKDLPKNELKERYNKRLRKQDKIQITALVYYNLYKQPSSNSIVFVMDKKDDSKYKFNYVKTIALYIEERYKFPAYKFTNCVTRDMIESSKFKGIGFDTFILDLAELKDNL